jgi:hypothetical protein
MPIVEGENSATLELMKQFPNVVAYGMLLLDDPKHPMAELVRERWSEINNLTGDSLVLFAFERPAEWSQNYLRYWRNKLGDKFEATWKQWQDAADPGAAYTYLRLFKPPLTPTQLPCLVLFTDADERQVVVRPIPNWDKDSLFSLLKGIVAVVQESAEKPKEERLAWLGRELTSPGARFLAQAGHLGSRAMDYFKQHPATVISTAISVVLGLSGAGLFTLPTATVGVINVLKDTLSGAKSGAA